MKSTSLQNGILYTVGVAAWTQRQRQPHPSGFIQTPIATGKSGAVCHLADMGTGVDRGAVPWGAMLVLGLARQLRRRGKRQRRSS